jgi:hypothetical protein
VTVAQLAARAAGIDDLRTAEYPGAIGVHLPEIREKIINVLFDQIIDGLTKPGTDVRVTSAETHAAPATCPRRGGRSRDSPSRRLPRLVAPTGFEPVFHFKRVATSPNYRDP